MNFNPLLARTCPLGRTRPLRTTSRCVADGGRSPRCYALKKGPGFHIHWDGWLPASAYTAKDCFGTMLCCILMKHLLVLPLVAAAALLTGCAVEPAYVEARPSRVYAPGPDYGPGSYYEGGPAYGGTTVVAVEHDRYVDREHYSQNGRGPRTSQYKRPTSSRQGGRAVVQPRYSNHNGGSARKGAAARTGSVAKPAARQKKDGNNHDQH